MSPFDEYERKKREASRAIAAGSERGSDIALRKTVSNLFRPTRRPVRRLDLRGFNNVLSVDKDKRIAIVEGRATYETVVSATLRHGLLPPVVPQLRTITVGGAISGGGIEASSFRHGFVHESVNEIEVLLSDGKTVVCRPDNGHADLFFGMANSYGTLGYILRVELPLAPAGRHVRLKHLRFRSAEPCFESMSDLCRLGRAGGSVAFIDGVAFAGDELYLTSGEFVDGAPRISNYRFMRPFYRSIREREVDYLAAEDFIWRWDTDWFWCSRAFGMEIAPVRFLFGSLGLLRSPVYWKMRNLAIRTGLLGWLERRRPREHVIQDVEVPVDRAPEFLEFLLKEVGVLPIWLCPAMAPRKNVEYPLYRMNPDTLYVNFGFWGSVPMRGEDGEVNRLIERTVQDLGGRKSLYSTSFFPEEEFWRIYNRPAYERLKDRYDPDRRLKDLYRKCVGGV